MSRQAALAEIRFLGDDRCELSAWVSAAAPGIENPTPILLCHGGGPDHAMFLPLIETIPDEYAVILPDVRGYGRSRCRDTARHTWAQYVSDAVALLDALGFSRAIIGGAGLGSTIALRFAVDLPTYVLAVIAIGIEDIEDDKAKEAEIRMMEAFALRVQRDGILAGWEPLLPHLSPIIGAMVCEAIPRSDAESIAAAAAIGRDRSFKDPEELAVISVPVILFAGDDARHPQSLAEELASIIPRGRLAAASLSSNVKTSRDFGRFIAPALLDFIAEVRAAPTG
ncbi:alpha/beta hydrolase [Sphingopyxis sp. PAMC25046]|uniref:Putative hydrolase or acyltransferase of alpha/beta superfamily n=3 Tax=Sphingomonadaceae TaxID=41297 RepID=A0A0A7PQ80_9SPHN|nr:putative hydrolase or acyltransferase of alpha/beta superfamily [Sphingopyxis fribergensis]KGB59305.1 putative hydrolase or acyltransferase of alpha/beta superfamily protein [Sphingopyxis sp. LC363]KTE03930.1 alpha/beta hydrolase [Sphingopyxis sp. H012]KTE05967.1 alpha/beta hydrolase [Sphingopyxis sp. H093]KTE07361.1 alpha/beta hydrolase [Sphingopyxis sp. H053]KTE29478.1 alpha/beta hydrolase [Sphingopyxis sp. H080]KTE34142.1 alpha/beta hydrolase [Sphingopyxis sp. H038]KTE42651.1 alpha/bet